MDELEERLDRIEARLQRLEMRLDAVAAISDHGSVAERLQAAKQFREGPPPFVAHAALIPQPSVSALRSYPASSAGLEPQNPNLTPGSDTEYMLWARIAPRVGAGAIIVALAYLVSLGTASHWITPAMLFGLICLLCIGFVGTGIVKLNVKEEFGQILTGIGSCGLYLNFAAGNIFQRLYSGETLVALFVALSAVNLGYSLWRSSRSFLAIGLFGGLIASVMPLKEHNALIAVALHLLIVAPAAMIAGKNRWMDAAAWLYGTSTFVLTGVLMFGAAPWKLAVFALDASALMTIAAYASSFKRTSWDSKCLVVPSTLGLTALIGFAFKPGLEGSLDAALFGTAILFLGFLLRTDASKQVLLAGAAIPLVFVPCGFSPYQASLLFAFLGVLCALCSKRWASLQSSLLSGIEALLCMSAYVMYLWVGSDNRLEEVSLLLAGSVAVSLASLSIVRSYGLSMNRKCFAGGLVAVQIARMLMLGFTAPGINLPYAVATVLAFLIVSSVASMLGSWRRWQVLCHLGGGFCFLGLCVYVNAFMQRGLSLQNESSILCVGSIAVIAACFSHFRCFGKIEWLPTTGAAVVGALVARQIDLLLPLAPASFPYALAAPLSMGVISAVVGLRTLVKPNKGLSSVAAAYCVGALVAYLSGFPFASSPLRDIVCLCVLMSSVVLATIVLLPWTANRAGLFYLSSMLGWGVATRMGMVVTQMPGTHAESSGGITGAWVLAAIVLLVVGIRKNLPELRYSSFWALALTLAKVMLYDLANTEKAIRVGILMGVGLTLLGGGYWFIRSRQQEDRLHGPGARPV